MKLFIVRHGEAETFAASDADRELTNVGRDEVGRVVRKNADELAAVTKLWVSPLRRAQQTADVILETLGAVPRQTSELLLPESSPSHALSLLSGEEASAAIMVVSHQPLVGELVNGLCGKPNGYYPMNTGALAHLDLDYPALDGGHLLWLR